ncbi:MAG: SMP-30/gluconolactonase/LRE family protein [Bacteroidetes bacterium]|nr:SMP-30/gluconolactonase/LRE family protein [Bacteroidota bacterium]
MKKILTLLIATTFLACTSARRFVATDLTPENSFSENCEGPNVDKAGNLYVVNYQRDGTVGIVTPEGKASVFVELPAGSTANAIRFDSRGDMLLADFTGHNVLKINMPTKKTSVFCHDSRFNQPNDLCISKKDIVFASDPNWKASTGQLWRIGPDGKATLVAADMGNTNGIELSPDERTLFVNESVQLNIWAFDITPDGTLSNKRLFTHFDDFGMDGMKCDRTGNLYVARYGKGVVAVFSPEGKLLREIKVKGKKTSNLAFGGKDGKTVFVTLQDRKCVETFRNDVAGKGF